MKVSKTVEVKLDRMEIQFAIGDYVQKRCSELFNSHLALQVAFDYEKETATVSQTLGIKGDFPHPGTGAMVVQKETP